MTSRNPSGNRGPTGAGAAVPAAIATTLAGWRAFVAEAPPSRRCCPGRLDTWTPIDRAAYDELRLAHHARLLVVATPTIRQVTLEGRRLQYLNRHAHSGRCGLILSGPARTGKTTA